MITLKSFSYNRQTGTIVLPEGVQAYVDANVARIKAIDLALAFDVADRDRLIAERATLVVNNVQAARNALGF